jgi:hypothetical protein
MARKFAVAWKIYWITTFSFINPATQYIVFRSSRKRQIKAWRTGNGYYSIGKGRNAVLAFS